MLQSSEALELIHSVPADATVSAADDVPSSAAPDCVQSPAVSPSAVSYIDLPDTEDLRHADSPLVHQPNISYAVDSSPPPLEPVTLPDDMHPAVDSAVAADAVDLVDSIARSPVLSGAESPSSAGTVDVTRESLDEEPGRSAVSIGVQTSHLVTKRSASFRPWVVIMNPLTDLDIFADGCVSIMSVLCLLISLQSTSASEPRQGALICLPHSRYRFLL